MSTAFDLLLAAALLWSAWRTLATPQIGRAVILFIVFGLLLTLVWARLDAPDIALAEAAADPSDYFRLPANRVIELGSHVII